MADGRHFENHKMLRYIRNGLTDFYELLFVGAKWGSNHSPQTVEKFEFQKFKMAVGRILKIVKSPKSLISAAV